MELCTIHDIVYVVINHELNSETNPHLHKLTKFLNENDIRPICTNFQLNESSYRSQYSGFYTNADAWRIQDHIDLLEGRRKEPIPGDPNCEICNGTRMVVTNKRDSGGNFKMDAWSCKCIKGNSEYHLRRAINELDNVKV